MTITEKRNQIQEELSLIEDAHERFAYIIDQAKGHPPLPDDLRTEMFRIEGCMSQLWLVPEMKEGKIWFSSDSDALITKGIAALLCDLYSGFSPEDIMSEDASFLSEVGVTQHLSPNRRNGLTNVLAKVRHYAETYQAELQA